MPDTQVEDLHPKEAADVLAAVKWAAGERTPIEIVGQGSKRRIGRPMQTAHTLDLSGLSGLTLFEPDELVLSARAGTPLAEIESVLDEAGQEMQFEPVDLGPVLGQPAGRGTLGGIVSTNFCGPRRLKAGSVRDHVLGIKAVSGRGEAFKSGGRVVKNVTGYDLSKGLTGAWGTLAVLTDITIKVLPRAETEATLVLHGLDGAAAARAMADAMGSSAEVSGAAHLPAMNDDASCTMLRLEGFETSVASRMEALAALLRGEQSRLECDASRSRWKRVRDCTPFADETARALWRVSCTPMRGHEIVAKAADTFGARALQDWQGGLLWLEMPDGEPNAAQLRAVLKDHGGGHATLIRASAEQRLATDNFQPQPAPMAALARRYRENFDPYGVLNPTRMGS